MKSREKRIMSGNFLEVECYPVTANGHRHDRNHRLSRQEQQALNHKNAVKRLTRLINTNFVKGDIIISATYRTDEMPSNEKEVLRDVQNYFRRINNYRKKHGLPKIKYIYVIECTHNKKTDKFNWHWHGIMSAIDRDVAEKLWKHGDFTNADRFQPTLQGGGEAFAKYISKAPIGKRRWNCSKNLEQPIVRTKDNTHTRREMARIAQNFVDDKRYWEREYKGYRFISATPIYNDFNGWWYIYVKMYRIE
ncbi:MAG: hypothetical protein PUD24_02755 [Oscillospiraceae bacterium]|nr:hypothetical protein [Oscillospiraceae bacterium]